MLKIMKNILRVSVGAMLVLACVSAGAAMVDKVIVVVNDEVITQREFDRAYGPIKASYEANFKGEELNKRLNEARKGLLEQLINSKLAISLAKTEDVTIDEAELETRVGKVKSFFGTEEEFLKALDSKGTNLTEFQKELREQMLAQKLIEKEVSAKINVTPGEVKELYEKNQEQLVSPVRVRLKGILIRKGEGVDEAVAREKIVAIQTELANGADFTAVATEKSEGPFAANGGDMGYVVPGQTLKEIDDVVFSLQPGESTGVVETGVGYHIFLVEEVQQPRKMELAEVSDFLKEQIFMRRFEQELKTWLEEKRKKAYVSYKLEQDKR